MQTLPQDEYDYDPWYITHGIDGSDTDTNHYDKEEIEEHNHNLLSTIEHDQMKSLHEGFPMDCPEVV